MKTSDMGMCQIVCWVIAVVSGMLAFWMAMEHVGGVAAFMLGLAFIFFLGLVLSKLFCDGSKAGTHYEKNADASSEAPPSAAAAAEAATAAAKAKAKASMAEIERNATTATAARQAKTQANAAKGAGAGGDGGSGASAAKEQAEANVDKAAKAAVEATKAENDLEGSGAGTAAAEAMPDYDQDGVREGTDEGAKPEMLSAAREGGADNLKEIKGVGPKMEQMLNEMGVFHFDQVAGWSADEVAWVDANLKGFKGRVSRDNWVEQAKILAAGGETEFSKRVEDGDVY